MQTKTGSDEQAKIQSGGKTVRILTRLISIGQSAARGARSYSSSEGDKTCQLRLIL